jgi:hypothetical protein
VNSATKTLVHNHRRMNTKTLWSAVSAIVGSDRVVTRRERSICYYLNMATFHRFPIGSLRIEEQDTLLRAVIHLEQSIVYAVDLNSERPRVALLLLQQLFLLVLQAAVHVAP